jgi:hypothetical protein
LTRYLTPYLTQLRPAVATPDVSTTIRLSQDMLARFKAARRGWRTRINENISVLIGSRTQYGPVSESLQHESFWSHRKRPAAATGLLCVRAWDGLEWQRLDLSLR